MNLKVHAQRLNRRALKNHALEAVELLDVHYGDTIVDIGAGGGLITFEFARLVDKDSCVFAADIKEELLNQIQCAKTEYDNIHTLHLEDEKMQIFL